jgi:hypothetical protein
MAKRELSWNIVVEPADNRSPQTRAQRRWIVTVRVNGCAYQAICGRQALARRRVRAARQMMTLPEPPSRTLTTIARFQRARGAD